VDEVAVAVFQEHAEDDAEALYLLHRATDLLVA